MLPSQNISATISNPELQMKAIRAILEPNFDKARPTPFWAGLGFSKSISEPMIKGKIPIGPLFSSNIAEERRTSYANEGPTNDLPNSLQSLSLDPTASNKIFSDLNNNMNLLGMPTNNNNKNTNASINNNINNDTNMMITKSSRNLGIVDDNKTNDSSNLTKINASAGVNSSHSSQVNNSNNNNSASSNSTAESSSLSNNAKISSCLRLAMFLGRIGLVKHLGLFTQHNIDLETLFTLNENDFAELGLSYVHRRKLAIAIAEVKSNLQNERINSGLTNLANTFDAAPGAERSKRQKAKCSIPGDISDIWSQ